MNAGAGRRCALVLLAVGIAGCAAPRPAPPVLGAVPAFELVDQHRRPVSADDLRGRPWVVDFVFTRCTSICPRMTERMAALERSHRGSAARFVSVSVDPEHDTPEVLRAYAERVRAGDDWLFLTGSRAAIQALSIGGFKLALMAADGDAPPPGEAILHSNRFVLVDAESQIRGYYDAFDRAELARLEADLAALLDDQPRASRGF